MVSKAIFEFTTQCVANSNHGHKIRHEAIDESISATASHILILRPSIWNALRSKFEYLQNKSEGFRLILQIVSIAFVVTFSAK